MGIPSGAVRQALQKEGKDPNIIDMDPEKSYASQVKKKDEVKGYILSYIHCFVGTGGNSKPTPAAINMSSTTASVQVLKSIIECAKNSKH